MNLGARTAMWAGGAKMPTARDYVQDGLIIAFDGIENVDYGVSNIDSTTWTNLASGERIVNLASGYSFNGNALVCAASQAGIVFGGRGMTQSSDIGHYLEGKFANGVENFTLDIVIHIDEIPSGSQAFGSYGYVFSLASQTYWVHFTSPWGFLRIIRELKTGQYGANPTDAIGIVEDIGKPKTYCLSSVGGSGDSYGLWLDGEKRLVDTYVPTIDWRYHCSIGGLNTPHKIHAIRLYNRPLTSGEIAANYAIDKARFGLP